MTKKKIAILLVLFVALAGFTLSSVSANNTALGNLYTTDLLNFSANETVNTYNISSQEYIKYGYFAFGALPDNGTETSSLARGTVSIWVDSDVAGYKKVYHVAGALVKFYKEDKNGKKVYEYKYLEAEKDSKLGYSINYNVYDDYLPESMVVFYKK